MKNRGGMIYCIDYNYIEKPIDCGLLYLSQLVDVGYEYGGYFDEHIQPFHEISYILSGTGTFVSDGKSEVVKQGDIHIISKGSVHSVKADVDSKLHFIALGFLFKDVVMQDESLKSTVELFSKYNGSVLHDNGNIRLVINMLISEFFTVHRKNTYVFEACMKQLIFYIERLYEQKMNINDNINNINIKGQVAYTVKRYIDSNIFEVKFVSDICKTLGYNSSYISHVFKNIMGITIKEYINVKKIEVAKYLIDSSKSSIAEISEILKYDSPQYFSKIFKKYANCSPAEYKKQKIHN